MKREIMFALKSGLSGYEFPLYGQMCREMDADAENRAVVSLKTMMA